MEELAIALAIPVFFTLIAIEWAVSRWRGLALYRFNDTIADLSCGIGQQMTGLLWKAVQFAIYVAVYEHAAVMTWDPSAVSTWVVAVLAVDHQYYWWHRLTHRSRLFWTTHVVHHQSEEYNLSVALRQAWLSSWSSIPVDLVLAVIGIPPVVFALCVVTNTLYQFWIHTELVGKLGPLEWVFNTPSHHRVHHAVEPRYLDKNYAGFLIIWDRLYGTFVEEDDRPTYGTVTPLRSWNPIWANVEPLVALVRKARTIPDAWDRLRYVFGPPEWAPASMGGPIDIPEPERGRKTWDARSTPEVHAYVALHFVLTAAGVTATLALSQHWPATAVTAVVVLVLWTTWTWGGLLEERAWARPAELLRLVAVPLVALWASLDGGMPGAVVLGAGGISVLSALWLLGPGRASREHRSRAPAA